LAALLLLLAAMVLYLFGIAWFLRQAFRMLRAKKYFHALLCILAAVLVFMAGRFAPALFRIHPQG
jgi:uncharacterized membrane protein